MSRSAVKSVSEVIHIAVVLFMWYLEERPSWTSAGRTNTKVKTMIPNVSPMPIWLSLPHQMSATPPPPFQKLNTNR